MCAVFCVGTIERGKNYRNTDSILQFCSPLLSYRTTNSPAQSFLPICHALLVRSRGESGKGKYFEKSFQPFMGNDYVANVGLDSHICTRGKRDSEPLPPPPPSIVYVFWFLSLFTTKEGGRGKLQCRRHFCIKFYLYIRISNF